MHNLPPTLKAGVLLIAACVLAVIVGLGIVDPFDGSNLHILGIVAGLMFLPAFLRWYHPVLIFAWNIQMTLFVLPTQPRIGQVMAILGAVAMVLQLALLKRARPFLYGPLMVPIGVMVAGIGVVIVARGELASFFAGGYGSKRYAYVGAALIGCMVLGSKEIPNRWRYRAAAVFVLSTCSYALGDIFVLVGAPAIFSALFPSMIDFYDSVSAGAFSRFAGIGWAGMTGALFIQMHYGVRRILSPLSPGPALFYGLLLATSLAGGHRVAVILPALVFLVQFVVEKCYRSRHGVFLVIGASVILIFVVSLLEYLPIAAQRTLSFLPGTKNSAAVLDAEGTFRWRLEMWERALQEVPRYLLAGKGYVYSAQDHELANYGSARFLFSSYESSMVDGTYHQGLLTVLIPLGLLTTIGFVWLLFAGFKIVYSNMREGAPELIKVNIFLFSLYVGRIIFYFLFYGQFDTDLAVFTGIIGMSMALNGGMPQRRSRGASRTNTSVENTGLELIPSRI